MSTGYRSAHSWERPDNGFTLGHDLRFIRQEVGDATTLGLPIPVANRNSPIPKSSSVNPGWFGEYREDLFNDYQFRTGDPTLKHEKMIQSDISLDYSGKNVKAGFRAFYEWGLDYITFENTNVVRGPPNGDVQQVSLRYVNTDLATFVGGNVISLCLLFGLDQRHRIACLVPVGW